MISFNHKMSVMKTPILFIIMFLIMGSVRSQMPEKFVKAMESRIAILDTTSDPAGFVDLANAFERIAEAEKNQWLPYYYAAYCNATAGLIIGSGGDMMAAKTDKTDPYAEKAEKHVAKAEELSGENSEIFIVKKMIATLKMIGDPMNRYMTYGPEAAAMLEQARKLNPDNPRIYLLEAQDKYYTPEQFGGSKEEAKVLFEKANTLFEKFKPEYSISPNWGRSQIQQMLSLFQ
jgi:hypothetical protein